MKRFLSIFVAIVMTLTMVVPAFAYTDTAKSDYNAPITHLSGLGVVNGYEDGSYQPEKVVTRAEMAKLLVVALGLEAGASLLEGTSSFADVPTTHWATGYIAVAVQYGLIKGDGDGNFRPDDTVNYAEVATMTLRALGYDRVVDKNGEWPTNYLNKANELKIFDDVVGKFIGTDGATRGTVAQMLWNMLNTNMWIVTGENENNGLNYGESKGTMLNEKFKNFAYVEGLVFDNAKVTTTKNNEWSVTVEFDDCDVIDTMKGKTEATAENEIFEYTGNDFYKFPTDTKFDVLVDIKNDVVVSMFVSDDNQVLVEGTAIDLVNDYTNILLSDTSTAGTNVILNANTTYVYALLEADKKSAKVKKAVEVSGILNTKVVEDITEGSLTTKIAYKQAGNNNSAISFKNSDVEDIMTKGIYFINGERATIADLEIGDVVTEIGTSKVFVVSRDIVSGDFDGIYSEKVVGSEKAFITVDDEDYEFTTANAIGSNATYQDKFVYELDNKDKQTAVTWAKFNEKYKDNDYIGQNVDVYYNAFGDAVKVLFGKVDATATEGSFFLVTTGKIWSVADSEGSTDYIQLTNEDGTASYAISEDADPAGLVVLKHVEDTTPVLTAGTIVWVEFNDDDEIIDATPITTIATRDTSDTLKVKTIGKATYADRTNLTLDDDYKTTFEKVTAAISDTNYYTISSKNYKVTSNTVVYTIKQEKNDDTDKALNKFTVEVSNGSEELKGLTEVVFVQEKGEASKIAYAFVLGDPESDDKYGTLSTITEKGGIKYYTVDGVEYEKGSVTGTPAEGNVVKYTISNDKINIKALYDANTYKLATDETYVEDVTDEFVTIHNDGSAYISYDLELIADEANVGGINYKDAKAFIVEVEYDKNDAPFFKSIEEIDLDQIDVEEGDGFVVMPATASTPTIIFIITGYDR